MDLERWLSQAVLAIEDWQRGFGEFDQHPSLQVSDERFVATPSRELTGAADRQLPVPPPALRRADAQAAAPGRGGRATSRRC